MVSAPTTLLRNALVAVLAADATVRTLCARTTGCVIAWSAITAAQFPVIALLVSNAEEIDGVDDPWDANVLFSCFADGARGIEIADALAQRARELVGRIAVVDAGMQAAPESVAVRPVDDDTLNPPGRSRVDLDIRYRVEVL